MGYLIFRGIASNALGLGNVYVSQMPSHKKASMRFTEYYVKGRDGALHVDEGYANFDITVKLVLLNATASVRQIVNAWADGTGKLISSDDLTLAYRATVKEEIQWTRVQGNTGFYDTATIIFNCEPCMYEAVDTVIEMTENGSVYNPGSAEAFPLIKVEGAGLAHINIAGNDILIDGMVTGVPVFIDCENGYVYSSAGAQTMNGEIPVFEIGQTYISFNENVTKLTITPHWRWV